ncbi:MAG: substrate-binding domain-containing protein [Myxococcota bacterium]|mgnify:CR=1 FL=1
MAERWRHMTESHALLVCVAMLGACDTRPEVVVFHAASLATTLDAAAKVLEKGHAPYRLRLEPSGSQVAARKISELGLRADVVMLADVALINELLVPARASWALQFATTEIVLAHRDHSRYTDEVTSANWPEILLRDDVRLGCVDADLAPIGYRTQLVWQLAQADLVQRLGAHCRPEHTMPDESELWALLEARAVDYAFLYRSTALDHHLKTTALVPEINLGSYSFASTYARAVVRVRLHGHDAPVLVYGTPIAFGLTVPRDAPHVSDALAFVQWLLGEQGRAVLRKAGLVPLIPAVATPPDAIPEALRALVRRG